MSALLALSIAFLGLTGCAADSVGSQSALFEVDPSTTPLDAIDEGWQGAPDTCDNRLVASVVDFRVVDDSIELLAAVDAEGQVVCVDSLEDVQDELESDGRGEEASELGDRFLVSIGIAAPSIDLAAADPNPQPSMQEFSAGSPDDASGVDQADPNPQPSDQGPPP